MTYLNNNYGIVKFEKEQNYKITDKNGIYKIVALPISFNSNNKELVTEYLTFFKNFSMSSWEDKIDSSTTFKNSKIVVELNKSFEKDIISIFDKGIDWTKEEENFDHIKRLVHFLPSLYIGKTQQGLKTRFTQHLNYQKDDSIINRIEKVELFKKCYKLFIWVEIEDDYIDSFESLLIQSSNPIFNIQRS
jgi:hypothetical protein